MKRLFFQLATPASLLAVCACAAPQNAVTAVQRTSSPPVHGLVSQVPSNAVSVLYVNYQHLRGDWKKVLDAGEPPKARREQQGFVESEDVDHAVTCALGESATPDNLALYVGRFGTEALAGSRIGSAGDLPRYRDAEMWGTDAEAIAKFSQQRVGVGARTALQASVDVAANVADPLTSEAWFREANESMTQAWPTARRVGIDLTAKATGPMRQRLASAFPEATALRWFSARAGGTEEFDLVALGEAETDDGAQALVYALSAQVEKWASRPQVRFMGLSGVLQAIRFEQQGKLAKATLHINENEWRQLKQRFLELLAFLRKRQAQAAEGRKGNQGVP